MIIYVYIYIIYIYIYIYTHHIPYPLFHDDRYSMIFHIILYILHLHHFVDGMSILSQDSGQEKGSPGPLGKQRRRSLWRHHDSDTGIGGMKHNISMICVYINYINYINILWFLHNMGLVYWLFGRFSRLVSTPSHWFPNSHRIPPFWGPVLVDPWHSINGWHGSCISESWLQKIPRANLGFTQPLTTWEAAWSLIP